MKQWVSQSVSKSVSETAGQSVSQSVSQSAGSIVKVGFDHGWLPGEVKGIPIQYLRTLILIYLLR